MKRVAEYSRLIALHCGLTHKEANITKLATPMHDIGNVSIANSILNKAVKLTDIEFTIIKTHAEFGYEYHEKYDGTGYPRGLG